MSFNSLGPGIRLQYQISHTALASRTRHGLRYSFISVGHRPWPWQIALRKFCDPESRFLDQAIDATIELAAASNAPPNRGDSILPNGDTPVWGSAVFKKDHSSLLPDSPSPDDRSGLSSSQ